MDVVILHKGVDISGYVISYNREQKICSGVGTLDLTISTTYPTAINTWDDFTLYEDGIEVGIYYVNVVKDSQPESDINVYCQDNSKRLSDYYISENYTFDYTVLGSSVEYTKKWITEFLNQAGVSDYTLSGSDEPISDGTSLGMASAYEQIVLLMQMSGLYMHFEGTRCIIGELDAVTTPVSNLTDFDILEIKLVKNDKMLRNRALVLGAGDLTTGKQVSAELHRHTNYNYDSSDLRTVVVSNSAVKSKADATRMASKLLSAFCRITEEKHVKLYGARNIKIGDFVSIENTVWSGKGMVTTVGSSMSESGLVTNLILDERCPRLFTCFNPSNPPMGGEYVYASTTTSGVFRKELDSDTWYPFSSGLLNLNVVDLYVNKGILSCIDSSGIAY